MPCIIKSTNEDEYDKLRNKEKGESKTSVLKDNKILLSDENKHYLLDSSQ